MSDGPALSTADFDPDGFRNRLDHLARTLATEASAGSGRLAVAARLARRLSALLARPLRLAVVGEANVGKTTLVNRLIGQDLLTSDVISNTRMPAVVRFAREAGVALVGPDGTRYPILSLPIERERLAAARRLELALPLASLEGIELIDTPPLDIAGDPRPLSERLDGKPDVVVWLTLATQAWRASEVALWRQLAVPGERAILVASHADLLTKPDRPRVHARLEREAGSLFTVILMSGEGNGASGLDQISTAIEAVMRRLDADRCRRAAKALRRGLDAIVPAELSSY